MKEYSLKGTTRKPSITKKQKKQRNALLSEDLNQILRVFYRRAAYSLAISGLNAVSASKLNDAELLSLEGVSQDTVSNLRKAIAMLSEYKNVKENFIA